MQYRRVVAMLGFLVATTSLIGPEPVGAADPVGVFEYVVARTVAGPTSINLDVFVPEGFTFSPAFVGTVGATVDGGHISNVYTGFAERLNGRPDPVVAAHGVTVSACGVGMCRIDGALGSGGVLAYQDDGQPGGMNRIYLVVEGPTPTVTLKGTGWSLEPATFSYRYIDGMHAGDASAYAEEQGVEVFRSATLDGAPGGSIAEGAPPCSGGAPGGGTSVQIGVGQVQLTGGTTTPSTRCPSLPSTYLASWAPGATQWSLKGFAVGNSTLQETRLFVIDLPSAGPGSLSAATLASGGYWLAAKDGGIFPFGNASGYGSTGGMRLNQPIVAMTATPTGHGYWLTASDGGIFPFGDAGGYGSTGGMRLNQPIVAIAATPSGHGYWLAAKDGGIFPFGDAIGYGSTGGMRLNQPTVAIAATPSGRGYWLTSRDGGIFPYGDAAGYGSTGGIRLNSPIVAIAVTPSGFGYWLTASDGGIFPFGDAAGYGSLGGVHLNQPIVAVAAAPLQ